MPLSEISPLELDGADRARLAPLLGLSGDNDNQNNPVEDKRQTDVDPSADDERLFLPVRTLRQQYIDYLDTKQDEIEEQKEARHYYHGAQLTAEQIRVLRGRHQPIQIWNRVARKINSIVGLISRMRSDPKAVANSPKSEQGAQIATTSIREALNANEFKTTDYWCLLQGAIDGIAGVQLVLIQGDKGDPEIGVTWVIGDEYFYDPKSYRMDFGDARYEGIAKWVDLDSAIEMFPEKADILNGLIEGDSDLTTNADREYKWRITAARRLRLVEHWYKHKGKWCWAFYVSHVLLDQGVSPFIDEKGKSSRSFDMFSAQVDHDGDRYGFVRNFKGPQDALNQGKSKTLALANNRLIIATKNAVDDVEVARREAARHDGFIEVNPQTKLEIQDHGKDIAAFAALTEDAKGELDGFANTNLAALSGTGLTNLSGRSIELLRQPGMAELGPFILAYRSFKLRLFRMVWNAEQRHWKAERWLRVNNNKGLAQFIQLNGVDLDQWGRPVLVNALGALDVDITLDEGPDVAAMMQETYDMLKGYPPGTFPPQMIIEMNPNIPRDDKDRMLAMMQPKPEQQQIQQATARLHIEGLAGKNAKQAAETRRAIAQAEREAATAHEKRSKVPVDIARAQQQGDLEGREFVRDTLFEAHKIMQPFLQPQLPLQGGGGPQQPQR